MCIIPQKTPAKMQLNNGAALAICRELLFLEETCITLYNGVPR